MFESFKNKLKQSVDTREDIAFRGFEEETEIPKPEEPAPAVQPPAVTQVSTGEKGDSNIELKLMRPESFSDVSNIADYLIEGFTVVLNTECLDDLQLRRMMDFLNGVTYVNDGEIKQVAKTTFIITPHNVDISDDIRG